MSEHILWWEQPQLSRRGHRPQEGGHGPASSRSTGHGEQMHRGLKTPSRVPGDTRRLQPGQWRRGTTPFLPSSKGMEGGTLSWCGHTGFFFFWSPQPFPAAGAAGAAWTEGLGLPTEGRGCGSSTGTTGGAGRAARRHLWSHERAAGTAKHPSLLPWAAPHHPHPLPRFHRSAFGSGCPWP